MKVRRIIAATALVLAAGTAAASAAKPPAVRNRTYVCWYDYNQSRTVCAWQP